MKLIVGLGNPGREYEGTRHNAGYLALDQFAEMCRADFDRTGFKGAYALVKNPSFAEPILLLKPETFMNLSGESVRAAMNFYKLSPEDVLVIYDDMAIEPGRIRLRPFGSSGAHKGMQNIIDLLGTDRIKRIRIGIGEPPFSGVDWVLTKPKDEEKEKVESAAGEAAKAIRDYLLNGWDYAMNHYNQKEGRIERTA